MFIKDYLESIKPLVNTDNDTQKALGKTIQMLETCLTALSSYCCRGDIALEDPTEVKAGWCRSCQAIDDMLNIIKDPEEKKLPEELKLDVGCAFTIAKDDFVAGVYWQAGYEPICPECGNGAFPTNFPPESVGGKKDDDRVVWFCKEMGHCCFAIDKDIKWRKKVKKE